MINKELKEIILQQMKNRGKMLWDFWEEYYDGVCTTYEYNKQNQSFKVTRCDIVAASFITEEFLSDQEMMDVLDNFDISDIKKEGFDV